MNYLLVKMDLFVLGIPPMMPSVPPMMPGIPPVLPGMPPG